MDSVIRCLTILASFVIPAQAEIYSFHVTPAEAGIQFLFYWIPAYAGMTDGIRLPLPAYTGTSSSRNLVLSLSSLRKQGSSSFFTGFLPPQE